MPVPIPIIAAMIGGGAALGSSFINHQSSRSAQQAGERATREAYERNRQQQAPYVAQGQAAGAGLPDRYNQYLDVEPRGAYEQAAYDPSGLIEALMQSYRQSPLNRYKQEAAQSAMRASAAAGGYGNLENEQAHQAELASLFADEGMSDWISKLLQARAGGLAGLQGQADSGLRGLENMAGRGYTAASDIGNTGWNASQQMGQTQASGIAGRATSQADLINALSGAATSGYTAYRLNQDSQPHSGYDRFNMPSSWRTVPFSVPRR